jgi:hypothetical protein
MTTARPRSAPEDTRFCEGTGIGRASAKDSVWADSAHIALERIQAEIDAIGVSPIPQAG